MINKCIALGILSFSFYACASFEHADRSLLSHARKLAAVSAQKEANELYDIVKEMVQNNDQFYSHNDVNPFSAHLKKVVDTSNRLKAVAAEIRKLPIRTLLKNTLIDEINEIRDKLRELIFVWKEFIREYKVDRLHREYSFWEFTTIGYRLWSFVGLEPATSTVSNTLSNSDKVRFIIWRLQLESNPKALFPRD